ncbi:hypothetical protein RF11_00335 [Thelohanellus kitauei]|uniref:Integrase catalytic domain-containing protein n=1 Tax=Thelohanellus kitauei TaxID=669202 RepID=A0A0C2IQN8_THEKT|nr:hypothetical protein RF11_00335 [Thelohanellus kitauei]
MGEDIERHVKSWESCKRNGPNIADPITSHSYLTSHGIACTSILLKKCLLRFVILKVMVADNGPLFKSDKFSRFFKDQGIKHVLTTPYHTRSNVMAERSIKDEAIYTKPNVGWLWKIVQIDESMISRAMHNRGYNLLRPQSLVLRSVGGYVTSNVLD